MAFFELKFCHFHHQVFMHGTNLGDKINTSKRLVYLWYDDVRDLIWVHFKGDTSFIPIASLATGDNQELPPDVKELIDHKLKSVNQVFPVDTSAPKRRGRPPKDPHTQMSHSDAPMIMSDAELKHREMVRAASANAHKLQSSHGPMNEHLIQEARNQAMGIKFKTISAAQVQTAQQVGEQASLTSKKKIMSHEELDQLRRKEDKDSSC